MFDHRDAPRARGGHRTLEDHHPGPSGLPAFLSLRGGHATPESKHSPCSCLLPRLGTGGALGQQVCGEYRRRTQLLLLLGYREVDQGIHQVGER